MLVRNFMALQHNESGPSLPQPPFEQRNKRELKRLCSTQEYLVLLWLSLAILGGACGLGIYTFIYAKGASYLSNDPQACGNCHIMREVLKDWQSGDHHHVAVCNDCHVPHHPVQKWLFKCLNGFHHSYAFTLTEAPVVIQAAPLSQAVVQKNCERCHQSLLEGHLSRVSSSLGADQEAELPRCVTCHRQVGHIH